ncbi:ABC transporter ATP-binding protein [Dehalobacter sp. DCM]|uniref:ABC transporter ATP-binding protein n=1 Tax=Dehalobacter sp. DCM TaxID=2907827 RepID=UPI00308188C1|nr:ABC transporter ATP-binding protein [Dehalobacter sp. DCM]
MSLKLVDISVTLSAKPIIKKLNLEVSQGELISLLGPSGCGKSTLLKTIAGLLPQQEGDIVIRGEIVNSVSADKRGAVIVFQDLRLFPNMTIEENIAFPLKLQGIDKAKRLAKAKSLLKSVQLEGYEKRRTNEMSGGQLQRVALARALAANPRILLLDEPFSSLDESLRQDMRRLVLDLHRDYGTTTILVTHDQQEALMLSDRIAVMLQGQIIQYDTPQMIYNHPANIAVADYFGGGNYIEGTVRNNHFSNRRITFTINVPDGDYTALFRSSALALSNENNDYEITEINYWGDRWDITVKGQDGVFIISEAADYRRQTGDKIGLDWNIDKVIMLPSACRQNYETQTSI